MKFSLLFACLALAALGQPASAHYFFTVLLTGKPSSQTALSSPVRWVRDYKPLKDLQSTDMTCNVLLVDGKFGDETAVVEAGAPLGFQIKDLESDKRPYLNPRMWHPGPVSFYLGRVPEGETAKTWDGSGRHWFKIDEITAEMDFHLYESWPSYDKDHAWTTIPRNTPSGEYLVRMEHLALHVAPSFGPEFYTVCAQIKVVNGGTGTPGPLVSIPGYLSLETDPGLTVDIYYGNLTSYKVPGPVVWRG